MNLRHSPALIALLAFLILPPVAVEAQSDAIRTTATYAFGSSITLTAEVEGGSPIRRAAVFLRSGSSGSVVVELARIDTRKPSRAVLLIQPAGIGLGAFEALHYWWQIDLESGQSIRSEEQVLEYLDDRFTWETLSTDYLTLLWHDRDLGQGQLALEIGQEALTASAQAYALFPAWRITIVLYNNSHELQAGVELAGASWAGGTARPEAGIMLVSAPASEEGMIDLERLLPHEMLHLLLEQRSSNGVSWMPAWLAEGMATLLEGTPLAAQREALDAAIRSGHMVPVVDLCAAFPVTESQAWLAYAESAYFVGYLLDMYGQGGLNQLLDAYREGATCEGAVMRVYQRPLSQLEAEWHGSVGVRKQVALWIWLLLVGAACLPTGYVISRILRARSRAPKGAGDNDA